MFTPFGAQNSGLFRTTPFTAVPPIDENEATVGGLTPKGGVLVYKTAPTAIAPAEFACPTILDAVVELYSSIIASPLKTMYLKRTLSVPQVRVIIMFAWAVPATVNGKTSIGSPQLFLRLKPNIFPPASSTK